MDYKKKYLKYKEKYLKYKKKYVGGRVNFDQNNLEHDVALDDVQNNAPFYSILKNKNNINNTNSKFDNLINKNKLEQKKFSTTEIKNTNINNLEYEKISLDDLEYEKITDVNTINDNKIINISDDIKNQINSLKKDISKIDINSTTINVPVINYSFAEFVINNNKLINIENGFVTFNIYIHPVNRITVYNNTISFAGFSIILSKDMSNNNDIKIDEINNKTFDCKHIIDMPNNNIVNGITLPNLLKIMNIKKSIKTSNFFIKIIKIHDEIFEKLLIKYNKEIDNKYTNYKTNEYNIDNIYDYNIDDMYNL